jgi:hypothetical protein
MDEEAINKILKEVPGSVRAADGVIIKGEDGSFFHATGFWQKEDLEGLTEDEHWFVAFCSKQEIIRLRSLRNHEWC